MAEDQGDEESESVWVCGSWESVRGSEEDEMNRTLSEFVFWLGTIDRAFCTNDQKAQILFLASMFDSENPNEFKKPIEKTAKP